MRVKLAGDVTSGIDGAPSLCASCAIRHTSLCSALSAEEIEDLNAIARRKRLKSGQTFVVEGEAGHGFANVTEGVAKLVRGAEDGRVQIVGLLFPSDFIGRPSDPRTTPSELCSIEAVSELELCLFPRKPFQNLLRNYPSLEHKLLSRTLDELQVAREWMVLLGRKTAEERVASFLLHAKDKIQNSSCLPKDGFTLPLGRADMADYLGLTLETVSRQMSKLKRDGIIVMEGGKEVRSIDEDRLRQRANF